ncbi:MAG: ABC transporter substrate-binding protein [Vallitalea sp.]|jgi:NitT/TauT family transport system substrate-binding protein|nr:ABC transporter substrate-binding protein [Vallitalea sp.]
MKKLTKTISLLIMVALISTSFVACNNKKQVDEDIYTNDQENESNNNQDETNTTTDENKDKDNQDTSNETENIKDDVTIKVATLKGPTGMGMAKLIEDVNENNSDIKCDFTITGSPDEIVGKVISKDVDMACIPTNLASVLYNKTKGEIQLAAVNTLGVLYIMETGDEINSIEDLKGKEILASGQGKVPEYILSYILEKNKVEDTNVNYVTEHAEVATSFISGDSKVALLPQPFVTTATMKNKEARIAINLTEEWEKIQGENSKLAMGCIIVNKEFANNNKELVNKFLSEYEESVNWVNNNVVDASKLIEKHEIIPKAKIAEIAIPNCNIVYINAEEAKETLSDFYQILFDFNPKSVGGKLPDGDFYFTK